MTITPETTDVPAPAPTRLIDSTSQDTTAGAWLNEHLVDAIGFHAVVGYLDRAGLDILLPSLLTLLDGGGEAGIVVDCRGDHPHDSDLAYLADMATAYGERLTIRLATARTRLHSKVFLIDYANGAHRALIGSANLTGAGLTRNLETCVAVDTSAVELLGQVVDTVRDWFSSDRAVTVSTADLKIVADTRAPSPTGDTRHYAELLQPALDTIEEAGALGGALVGVPTGFCDLDRLLNGLRGGQMIVVAGRPGIGKTTLTIDMLRAASIRNALPALYMTFEMTAQEVIMRVVAAETKVPLNILRSGQLGDDEWIRLAKGMGDTCESSLLVNDTCRPTLRHLITEVRRVVREHDIKIVAVDYIQLLNVDRRTDNRAQEVSEISRALKALAVELRVPILVVSQLNRNPETRTDRRPMLSDLRDSGQLEQDADVVILVYRDDYYDKLSPRAGEADLIVAKHRNGPTDTVTVAAQLHLARFVDMVLVS